MAFSNSISTELSKKVSNDPFEEVLPWGASTKGFSTIKARTNEGLVIYMDILISYKLTTSNDDGEKA